MHNLASSRLHCISEYITWPLVRHEQYLLCIWHDLLLTWLAQKMHMQPHLGNALHIEALTIATVTRHFPRLPCNTVMLTPTLP